MPLSTNVLGETVLVPPPGSGASTYNRSAYGQRYGTLTLRVDMLENEFGEYTESDLMEMYVVAREASSA